MIDKWMVLLGLPVKPKHGRRGYCQFELSPFLYTRTPATGKYKGLDFLGVALETTKLRTMILLEVLQLMYCTVDSDGNRLM